MIGQRIKDQRLKKKLSQTELGNMVGKTADVICKIEKGKRRVTGEEVKTFADALEVSVSDLLDDTQAPTGTDG